MEKMNPTTKAIKAIFLLWAGMMALGSTACQNKEGRNAFPHREPGIIGTWHYEAMAQTLYNTAADTLHYDYLADKDLVQCYDVYRNDSVLNFYALQGDSVVTHLTFRYTLRNDSIISRREGTEMSVHIIEITDSIMHLDYTRTQGDTVRYFRTKSRRSGLPQGLQ